METIRIQNTSIETQAKLQTSRSKNIPVKELIAYRASDSILIIYHRNVPRDGYTVFGDSLEPLPPWYSLEDYQ